MRDFACPASWQNTKIILNCIGRNAPDDDFIRGFRLKIQFEVHTKGIHQI